MRRAPTGPRCWPALLALLCVHCVGELDLPEPPALAQQAQRYEAPTAELSPQSAEAFLERFAERRAELVELDDMGPLVDALVGFDQAVTSSSEDDDPAVQIDGVPIRTDAVLLIAGSCPGWEMEEPAADAFEMTAVVRRSQLLPTIWGSISKCRYQVSRAGSEARFQLSGEVAAYLPNLLAEEDAPRILFVQYQVTELEVNGSAVPGWSGEFRIVEDRLELLIRISNLGSVVVFATQEAAIGVRAANGTWTCYPEERRCEQSSADSFSY